MSSKQTSTTMYEIKIKLTSTWLGEQKSKTVRKFKRAQGGQVKIDHVSWNWAINQATQALHLHHIDVETIRFEDGFEAPSLVLYNRKYRFKGKPREEMFEAIREGTVITTKILVTDPAPSEHPVGNKAPTKEELKNILTLVGSMLGLSQWGNKYGYGRFNIKEMNVI